MSTIALFIYSFQNNDLINIVHDIIEKSSKKNIIVISLIDQNSINHYKKFNISKKNIYINYKYKTWDSIESPIKYKKDFIDSVNTDFSLICSDGVQLCKNWDQVLVDFILEKDIILSGNTMQNLIIKNDMIHKIDFGFISDYCLSNNINRSFIFGKTKVLKKLDWPVYLKYYGEEEILYASSICNRIPIYKVPAHIYRDKTKNLNEYDYLPFSLTHNYNIAIEKIKQYNIENNALLNSLTPIKYQSNDVEYNPFESEFNKIAGERYLNKTRSID